MNTDNEGERVRGRGTKWETRDTCLVAIEVDEYDIADSITQEEGQVSTDLTKGVM